jgi:hypothetical protein
VSIERRHQGASFGAIPIAIEEELNVFESILSLKAVNHREDRLFLVSERSIWLSSWVRERFARNEIVSSMLRLFYL